MRLSPAKGTCRSQQHRRHILMAEVHCWDTSTTYTGRTWFTTNNILELHPTPAQVHGWLLVSQLVATVHPRPPAAKKRSTKACRSGTEQVVYAPLQFVMQLEDHVDDDAGNRVVSPLGTLPVR